MRSIRCMALVMMFLFVTSAVLADNMFAEREEYLREHVSHIVKAELPKYAGVTWSIVSFDHEFFLTYLEVEAETAAVDHPRFMFMISFQEEDAPFVVATYEEQDGSYWLKHFMPGGQGVPSELRRANRG